MRPRLVALSSLALLVGVMSLPAAASASGGFSYTVIHDYCGRPYYTWTNHFKVSVRAAGTTNANMLTIDAKAQSKSSVVRHARWITDHTFNQVVIAYAQDGTAHALTAGRQWTGGGIEQHGRIVMTLRAWHYASVLWTATVISQLCP